MVVGAEDLEKEVHLLGMKLVGVCQCSFERKVA